MRVEKRALQIIVVVACVVPVGGSVAGVILGPSIVGATGGNPTDLDSHFRYLSGLLLAIGLGFLATVRKIERHRRQFRLLGALVVLGGLSRLLGMVLRGPPSGPMVAALVMELVVTPLLRLWQGRVSRKIL